MDSVTMKELQNQVSQEMREEAIEKMKEKSIFDELNSININGHTEEKNGLTYLSWAWAWSELKKKYPNALYRIERFGEEKKPYLYDEDLGYMVFTSITIDGLTHEMWLPVMDNSNKAMKDKPYTYKAKKWNNQTKRYDFYDKPVESATMFDINKSIMRCLVKNIGMFGLGLYIYAGEDLPEEDKSEEQQPKQENKQININDEIKKRTTYLIELGVDFGSKGTIDFINKYNHGKHDVTKMDDKEKMNYCHVLDEMIKIKKKGANK